MPFTKWIDLELPDDGPQGAMTSVPFDLPRPKGPQYPYGMRLCLDNHTLDAAGIEMAEIEDGAEIDIRAMGKVVGFSNDEGQRRVTIQLTRIKVENEDHEDEED